VAAVILFPAIDLKEGRCVRLKRGAMDSATVFNDDPAAQAMSFERAGFEWLHCVDLDGAFAGRPANVDAIKAIRAATGLPIQLGGGIRDMKAVEGWLAAGISRVILGTAALKNPALVREAAREFPGRVVVGADAKGGRIAT
jgi:phosphoribosylformimino-5-aminoimidazole carboxamide ribotide isomerase